MADEIDETADEAVSSQPMGRKGKVDVVEEVDDDEDDRPRRKKKGKAVDWLPCPKCDGDRIKKVVWTMWGSFYGPALLSHVRCLDCGYKYNGRTGRSNLIPAIFFVSVPLLGMLGVLGWIGWKLYKTYVLMQD